MTTLMRTPLYEAHLKAGAKLIDFGGWEMPVQYEGILEEHLAVRTRAGLFDVSHMGEIQVSGSGSLEFVNTLITNDVSQLLDGQILYSPMCNEAGGVLDDLLVYRHNSVSFLFVVNAANTDKDFAWIVDQSKGYAVNVLNASAQTAQLAFQGPRSESILQIISSTHLSEISYYRFTYGKVAGVECLISRTGYTGEDGFELYFSPEHGLSLWNQILAAGEEEKAKPIGLGARDTLRFEACLPLYCHELGEDISPLEAGLGQFVKLEKAHFVGKRALADQRAAGVPRKLIGLEMLDRGIPRAHYPLFVKDREIGFITSGSFAPTLEKNLGLGLIQTGSGELGQEIEVLVRGKGLKAQIIPKPFYKRKRTKF